MAQNAAVIRDILDGKAGPAADIVALNAAFVAVAADRAPDIGAGLVLAREAIANGAARHVLEDLAIRSVALAGGVA